MWDIICLLYWVIIILSFLIMFIELFLCTIADSKTEEREYSRCSAVFGIIFLILIAFNIYGHKHLHSLSWEGTEAPQSVEKIVSLSDNSLVTGKLYLRRGYIDQDLWYQYMVELNDGGFVANKVKSTDTTLYYSDGNYRVEWYTKERHWLWFYEKENYHKIFIPAGSITDEYSIDLK